MHDAVGAGSKAPRALPSRRVGVLLAGGLLFAGLLTLSLALKGFDDLTFLYVLPITIVAIELGFLGGVAAGILALGYPRERALGSLRLSVGKGNTDADIDLVLNRLPAMVARLRAMAPISAA